MHVPDQLSHDMAPLRLREKNRSVVPALARSAGLKLHACARVFALLGGVLLIAEAALMVFSGVLRTLFAKPLPGTFEAVEIGIAVVVSFFLPIAQAERVHPGLFSVENRFLRILGDVGVFLLAFVLCWRHAMIVVDFWRYREESMVLHIPLWWGACVSLVALVLWVLVAATQTLESCTRRL